MKRCVKEVQDPIKWREIVANFNNGMGNLQL